jgi:superfamily II DNA or RNA helicase
MSARGAAYSQLASFILTKCTVSFLSSMSEIINPNQLFRTLSLKPDGQIKKLWDSQAEVLDIYYAKLKDSKKVAIELPTGSGKSIISILILEMWRRTGKRVAILTSSIALGDDMGRRCNDLGAS